MSEKILTELVTYPSDVLFDENEKYSKQFYAAREEGVYIIRASNFLNPRYFNVEKVNQVRAKNASTLGNIYMPIVNEGLGKINSLVNRYVDKEFAKNFSNLSVVQGFFRGEKFNYKTPQDVSKWCLENISNEDFVGVTINAKYVASIPMQVYLHFFLPEFTKEFYEKDESASRFITLAEMK